MGFYDLFGYDLPIVNPYLKGINFTIDVWRPGRYEEGWKLLTSNLLGGCANDKWVMI